MSRPLRVLLVEDSPEDAKLILRELNRGGYQVTHTVVATAEEMRAALERQRWDVVLCDYVLPQFSGHAALELVRQMGGDEPFIYVSGTIGEETAVAAMRSGAQDYVMKDNLARLPPAVDRELREASTRREARRAELALRESEHKYRHLFDSLSDAAFVIEQRTGRIIDTNRQACVLLGRVRSEILGLHHAQLYAPSAVAGAATAGSLEGGADIRAGFDAEIIRKDRKVVPVRVSTSEIDLHGRPLILALFSDITERKRTEEALRASEERFRQVTENIDEVFWLTDASKEQMIYVSPAYARIWGRSCESLGAAPHSWLEAVHPDDRARVKEAALTPGLSASYDIEYRIVRPDGAVRWIHDRAFPIKDAAGNVYRVAGVAEDITARRQLEDQFRQSQKMEAVGRLAGGIAHDFNNLLAVIQIQASMLSEGRCGPEVREGLQQIMGAAERGSNLTRQLLTFSRRGVKQARDIDLGEVVGTMTRLLRRLLGEHIILDARFAPVLPIVNADPGMMEQVVMNLALNARDAMPEGGRLTVTLEEQEVDAPRAAAHPPAAPGCYVCLKVTDTGCGIPPESLPRLFEPFFTTKEDGKGTGLGLATVFGIVQQHRGWIEVESEVGRGTTFRVLLPALAGTAARSAAPIEAQTVRSGTETILLVEDDAPVRALAQAVLERYGYQVLVAESGAAALELWEQTPSRQIELLLTDLVMPGAVSGPELAERLLACRPELKIIYTSGYNNDVVNRRLHLEPGRNFLQKPYAAFELAAAVRRCLDHR